MGLTLTKNSYQDELSSAISERTKLPFQIEVNDNWRVEGMISLRRLEALLIGDMRAFKIGGFPRNSFMLTSQLLYII